MKTRATEMFGLDLPIFAFSHCRDVVAAVSKAGGMGVLGALAFTPEELEMELAWIDEHVDGKPYGVDVVMPANYAGKGGDLDPDHMDEQLSAMIPQEHKDFIERVLAEHNVPPLPADEDAGSGLLGWTYEGARPQVDVAFAHPIKLLVNALGPPPPDIIEEAHAHGVKVAALVGTVAQAERQVNQGVDMIMAQGYEAGGHTGDVGVMILVPEVVDAVGDRVPVLAAGGVGSGRQMAASIALGAEGVWTGSIWLTTAESDMSPAITEKLLAAGSRDTVRSRVISGKPARQLRTEWTDAWEREDSPGYLPMPLQYMATSDATRRITKFGVKELQGMPVGQIVGRMNEVRPVRDVVFDLVEEFVEVTERLDALRDTE
ncbi:MAG: nitronate monooxygenase family protein [Acidimicrobiia bacterium]|nr:nitronate monooxygenase family protein [Acidimicrobiia bacterium]